MSENAFETIRNAENEAAQKIENAKTYYQNKKDEAAAAAKALEDKYTEEIDQLAGEIERSENAKKAEIISQNDAKWNATKTELDAWFEANRERFVSELIKKGVSAFGDSKD